MYKKEYDELVTEMLIKLESLVEYLMNGIEMPENVSIYVVGGCKYYTNFANIMKEALGEKAMICNPTREVENTSHGCWKVVHDMMEGKLKIEGSDIVWGFENEEEEGGGGRMKRNEDNKQGDKGSASPLSERMSELSILIPPSGTDVHSIPPSGLITIVQHTYGRAEKGTSRESIQCIEDKQSHSVTIKVCEYPRLPLPHRLKAVDFAKSIRDFMKKMLLQEKEILKINSISTLWNDISKRIYEKIEKLKNQDKADELLIELNKLDKKKYTVLMDSVEEMNKDWKKLADELKVNIENEMAQISIIQNEWKKEKSRIDNIMDSKASSSKSTLKGEYYEIEYKEDNESKRIKTSDHCAKKLIQMQKQLLELQDELLKQEEEQRQKQLEQQQLLHEQEQEQKSNERYSQLVGNLQLLVQEHLPNLQSQLNDKLRLFYYDKDSLCYQIRSDIWKLKNQINKRYGYESKTITELIGKLDNLLQQLQQYEIGSNSLYMQEQLLTMLQQYEQQQYGGNSNIPYSEISKLIQRYKQDGISIYSRIKQLKERILYYYKNYNINKYLTELENLQILLSFRFYEMSRRSRYFFFISQLQQFISQDQDKFQDKNQGINHYGHHNQGQNENQNKSQNDKNFLISKLQQTASIQKGLSSLFPEVLQLGIEDSTMYPQLDYLIQLLSKYVNGYYSIYKELQEQLDKLPELLEELKQK